MFLLVSMFPHMANDLKHTFKWFFIVSSCVCMCPCVPMWPMFWYIPITSESGLHSWANVTVCAHMPPCVDTQQWCLVLVYHCELMCPCTPMWPMSWDSAITSNTWCPLWNHVSLCAYLPNILYTPMTSENGCSLPTHGSVCAHVPLFDQWFDIHLWLLRLELIVD